MQKILHIIPYNNLYPPQNGGQLRCFHLMDNLAFYFNIDVICFQAPNTIICSKNSVRFFNADSVKRRKNIFERKFPRLYNAIRYRWLTLDIIGPANKETLDFTHVIKYLSNENKYEYIIYEHLSGMRMASLCKRLFPESIHILDAHNVDHILVGNEIGANKSKKNNVLIKSIFKQESKLYNKIDYFLACSKKDKEILEKINNNKIKGMVVPNGVDIENKPFIEDTTNEKIILFCGALNTIANREGLLWFYRESWSRLTQLIPLIKLIIIGSGEESEVYQKMKDDDSIVFLGRVNELESYYRKASVSIVPLTIGSGTRLKILESMSFGVPVVSTSIGADGVSYPDDSIKIADNATDFTNSIKLLINTPSEKEKIRRNALQFVKDYDWKKIAQRLSKSLFIVHYIHTNESSYKNNRFTPSNCIKYILNIKKFQKFNDKAQSLGKNVLIDIKTNYYHRYLTNLIQFLTFNGYNVLIKNRFDLFAFPDPSFLKLHQNKRVYKYSKKIKANIIISDQLTPDTQYITADYFLSKNKDKTFIVPMSMHPNVYLKQLHKMDPQKTDKTRSIKALFAGNTDERAYSNPIVSTLFENINRYDIINYLKANHQDIIFIPTSKSTLLKNQIIDKVVIVERTNFSIPIKDLLQVLFNTDFYLALPGVEMPHSHNVIEAMYCGCIPILQYSNLFNPPLENYKNCISFNNYNQLTQIINNLNTISQEEIVQMRRNVLKYYHNWLSPEAVVSNLEKNESNESSIQLNAERESVILYAKNYINKL